MAFSNAERDRLYDLLPAFVRSRDQESGEALRALLDIIDSQADLIEEDIGQLQENAFIETCEPWAVAYIGDLVGTSPLFDESRIKDGDTAVELFRDLEGAEDRRIKALHGRAERSLPGRGLRPLVALRSRADVAKTIYYRRRKGTLPMLEELARDVTGWPAHAVEYFELLGWTQYLRNHLRPHALRTPDIRSIERMDRLGGAFDEIQHSVDVRPLTQDEGWYNIRNIGFHLWRLAAYALERTTARSVGGAGDFRYFFSPLGQSAPLFSRVRREGDESGLATELHVPQPIRPARFYAGIGDFYGALADSPSLTVHVDGTEIPVSQVICRNLSSWSQPAGDRIAIDVVSGRMSLGPALVPADKVEVSYHYGFPADLGGGPYRRRSWLIRRNFAPDVQVIVVGGATGHPSVAAALTDWVNNGQHNAVISIQDSRTYDETIVLDVTSASGNTFALEAADGFRPHLRLAAPLRIAGDRPDFAVTLSGLLIEGRVVIEGSLHRLRLLHSTLVPAGSIAETEPPPPPQTEPSLAAVASLASGGPANQELAVEIAFSILGAIRLPVHAEGLTLLDSIVDGTGQDAIAGIEAANQPGPALRSERVTIRGRTLVREIDLATETIFDGHVEAARVQKGCVRFSYAPATSRTPRRYRCQPDLTTRKAIEEAEAQQGPLTPAEKQAMRNRVWLRVKPEYTSEAYGQPAYLQLSLKAPEEIAKGAADGSEMGTYCHLKQPQREANLHVRLKEYLPFGLDYGLVYVT
ncbi:hypothetical protein G5V57_20280 [Nordella sp. HKS 07]|uniref:hypothetical protein n=1 Tax=Nordella sp. HKS 07 TaxID=2712222 RepID=UPI0013E1557F|nr:hypothetical protein [Nordella sp. HKS 07]QIG49852.1 hypothetical protein G5V57_20280 [Nordella sp. HKS 07]